MSRIGGLRNLLIFLSALSLGSLGHATSSSKSCKDTIFNETVRIQCAGMCTFYSVFEQGEVLFSQKFSPEASLIQLILQESENWIRDLAFGRHHTRLKRVRGWPDPLSPYRMITPEKAFATLQSVGVVPRSAVHIPLADRCALHDFYERNRVHFKEPSLCQDQLSVLDVLSASIGQKLFEFERSVPRLSERQLKVKAKRAISDIKKQLQMYVLEANELQFSPLQAEISGYYSQLSVDPRYASLATPFEQILQVMSERVKAGLPSSLGIRLAGAYSNNDVLHNMLVQAVELDSQGQVISVTAKSLDGSSTLGYRSYHFDERYLRDHLLSLHLLIPLE